MFPSSEGKHQARTTHVLPELCDFRIEVTGWWWGDIGRPFVCGLTEVGLTNDVGPHITRRSDVGGRQKPMWQLWMGPYNRTRTTVRYPVWNVE